MSRSGFAAAAAALSLVSLTFAMGGEQPAADPGKTPEAAVRPTPAEARRSAETLHTLVHSTLHIVHHHYYREDEGMHLPAALLKDSFAAVEEENHVKLRWLVVEGQAMNSEHKARDSFEREAVKALKSGKSSYDRTENGVYRRAGSITLLNDCLKCHVPNRTDTRNRTAGLVISIPIESK